MAVKISELTASAVLTSDDIFPVVDSGSLTTKRVFAEQVLNYITSSTFDTLTVTSLTGSTVTGSLARFTTISGSNANISGSLVIEGVFDFNYYPDYAYIIYTASYDKLVVYPGLYVSGNLTGSGAGVFQTVSASSYLGLPTSSGGTPGGTNTTIQFNDNGSFSGSSVLVFDKNTNELIGENIVATSVLRLSHSLGPVFSVSSPAADSITINADGNTNFLTIQNSTILTASLFTGPQTTFLGGVGSKMQILSNNLSINKPATNFANATLDVNGNTIISGNLTVTGSSSSLGVNNEPGSGARVGAAKLGNVSGSFPNQFAVFGHHQVVDFNPLAAAVLQKSSTSTRFGGLNEIQFGFISPQEVLKIKNGGDEGRPRIIVSGAADQNEEVADLIIGAEQSEGYKTFIVGPNASNINLVTYSNLTNERPALTLSRRRQPGSPLNSDNLGEINWIPGTLSGGGGTGAGIRAKATQDWIFGVAQGSELQFYVTENATNIQTTRLHISNNGNVGIGTENPDFKLSVTGTLGVSGTATLSTVSGTTAQFTTISGSVISASLFVGPGIGGATPGGTNTTIQFNSGSAFSGSTRLSWDYVANTLFVSGSTNISGTLTATAKSFDIVHPTRDGMRLRYGSLEGPENGVYVRGRTQEKVVQLPDYWTGLVDENTITVNLTPVGTKQDIWVDKVENNTLYIAGDLVDCYFSVFAERKDIGKLLVEY